MGLHGTGAAPPRCLAVTPLVLLPDALAAAHTHVQVLRPNPARAGEREAAPVEVP